MIKIRECSFAEIKHLSGAARRERSVLSDGPNHVWFMALASHGEIVGCSCAAVLRGAEGRIKGTFVVKDHRGQGISKDLNGACLDFLDNKAQCASVTAFVTTDRNLAWYLKSGFTVQREKDGIAFVKKLL